MECGRCGKAMEEGRVEVHSSPGTVLFKSWSQQDLYWYDKAGKRNSRRELVQSGTAKRAFGCKPCGLVTIATGQKLVPRRRWWSGFRKTP